ncbi:glycosyltransferase family 2 protein [Pedobacter sp. SYP-B3415]|uniref:glycosyltransferase family 2 protein n=1 Tax=Pedobacter sp. SYP-B3415 TaxID=2496641 RepID=UPI00101CFE1D|nr:glycosyltransferase [Pedobacter sp. SYP-B3415]
MKIAIVIPTFNRVKLLGNLLNQLFSYGSASFQLHVIVVNDGSTDQTPALLNQMSRQNLSVIEGDGNWWWTKSFNTGMVFGFNQLQADHVISFNDDVEIYEGFFEQLNQVVGQLTQLHGSRFLFNIGTKNIATGQYEDLGVVKDYKRPFRVRKNTISDFTGNQAFIHVNHNHGRGMFVTRALFETIGEMDYQRFPQYLGDSDYGLRANRAGFTQYFTRTPYLMSFVELTAKSKYEKAYSLTNFYKRITDKYSDTNLRVFYDFNRKHFGGLQFLNVMLADIIKINGGYLKRWLASKK